VGVALGAVADDGDFFRLDEGEVCVVIVVGLCHDVLVTSFVSDSGVSAVGGVSGVSRVWHRSHISEARCGAPRILQFKKSDVVGEVVGASKGRLPGLGAGSLPMPMARGRRWSVCRGAWSSCRCGRLRGRGLRFR
jgi:hypothetical protein